jgi:glutaconyl-CoA decarboxylase
MKMFRVVVNGNEYKVAIEELAEEGTPQPSGTTAAPAPPRPAKPQPAAKPKPVAKAAPAAGGGAIVAPMPGTVLRVAVNVGDNVVKGQTLLVLEAMKMENEIMAPADGAVQEVNVTQGVSVNAGDILVVLSS